MRLKKIVIVIVNILMMSSLFGCGHSLVGGGGSDVIYLSVMSRPVSADVYWRIVSSTKEVMSGNRLYLGVTPYRKTKSIRIPGLTRENASQVTLVLELEKPGYDPVIEHFNMSGILSHPSINVLYHLRPGSERGNSVDGKAVTITEIPISTKQSQKSHAGKVKLLAQKVRASRGKYSNSIRLSWSAVIGAKAYEVYRDNSSRGKFTLRLAMTTSTHIVDRDIKPGKIYYYKVRAYIGNNYGPLSRVVSGYSRRQKHKR